MEDKGRTEETVLNFFESITDDDIHNLEKSADILMTVFKKCIPVGDETCVRLMSSLSATESERKYYESVLVLCNTIMALACMVAGVPDPNGEWCDE